MTKSPRPSLPIFECTVSDQKLEEETAGNEATHCTRFPCKHTHTHTAAHTQPHLETTSGGHWHSDGTRSPGLRVLGGHAVRVRGQVGPQKGAAV